MNTAELDALLTEVRRAGERGDASEQLQLLQDALLDTDAAPMARSLVLSQLATTLMVRGSIDEADRYANRALSLARLHGADRAEARALFVCGQLGLHRWAAGEPGDDRFAVALDDLERSAAIFDRLDSIDLLPVLLTIAEAIVAVDEPAAAVLLYQRVLVDARKPGWLQHGTEMTDGFCARACFGLAECALVEHRHDDARAHLERALALTTRYALDAVRIETLGDIADAFERGLGDELQARRLRKHLPR